MPRLSSLVPAAALALGLIALTTGCGGSAKPVSVSGKIVMPAKAKIADTDVVTLVFEPETAGEGMSENATASAKELTFTAKVIPGKYKISVSVQPYAGQSGGQKEMNERNKELTQAFGGFSNNSTPLRYEVTKDAAQTITVDLDKKSVK